MLQAIIFLISRLFSHHVLFTHRIDDISSCPPVRLGIDEVLGHQSVLAQQYTDLQGSSSGACSAHLAMERLSALQTSTMQSLDPNQSSSPQTITRQRQQLLLSLADLQRDMTGAEDHQRQQQSVLEQYHTVCEVLRDQITNTVSMLVERNNLIDALSRKQNELTAKLAMQV